MVSDDDNRMTQEVVSPLAGRGCDNMQFADICGSLLQSRTKEFAIEHDGVSLLEENCSHG